VQCVNDRIAAKKGNAYKCMTVVNENGGRNIMQAMTGPEYGRIFDADVAQLAMRIVANTKGRFHNPLAYDRHSGQPKPSGLYASDRDIFIFMIDGGSLLEAGPRAKLNRGFFLKNSEVGKSVLALTMFCFNTCCGNHFIYGANGIVELRIKHTSGGPGRFINEAMPQLLKYVNESDTGIITSVKKAQDYLLPVTKREDIIDWLQKPELAKLTKSEAVGAYETAMDEEKECRTLWNAIQGITAYARDFAFVDARNQLESKASRLMRLVA
jgi:hypothetical protein